MAGRSSTSFRWHLGYARRGIHGAVKTKGSSTVKDDLATIRDVARKIRANREALDAGQPLPYPS